MSGLLLVLILYPQSAIYADTLYVSLNASDTGNGTLENPYRTLAQVESVSGSGDSILPHLIGSSTQTMVVRNFNYRNTKQIGNPSNTGIEAFNMGAPFVGEENWCNGCRLRL